MLEVSKIPNELLHDVLLVKEICQVTLLDKDKRKQMGLPNGSPDTMIISLLGNKRLAKRDEIMDNFRNKDGSNIKLSKWHYGKKYIVYKDCNIAMKMFTVPSNSKMVLSNKGKRIDNDYCILYSIKNNNIDKSKIKIISKDNFKKQFKIVKVASKEAMKNLANTMKVTKNIHKENAIQQRKWRQENKKVINEKAIAIIVATLVNNKGSIVGYRVRNIKNNKEIDFALNRIKELCRNQKIKNMTIVAKDGKEFLRGIGIKKENLPKIVYKKK